MFEWDRCPVWALIFSRYDERDLASEFWIAGDMYRRRCDLVGFVNGIRQLQKSLLNGVDDRPTLSELLPPDASVEDVDKEHIKNLPRFDAAEDADELSAAYRFASRSWLQHGGGPGGGTTG